MQLIYRCCAPDNRSGCSSIIQLFINWFGREFNGLCKSTVNFQGFALILVVSAFEFMSMSNCCWIGWLRCPCSVFSVPFGGFWLHRWSDCCFSRASWLLIFHLVFAVRHGAGCSALCSLHLFGRCLWPRQAVELPQERLSHLSQSRIPVFIWFQ